MLAPNESRKYLIMKGRRQASVPSQQNAATMNRRDAGTSIAPAAANWRANTAS